MISATSVEALNNSSFTLNEFSHQAAKLVRRGSGFVASISGQCELLFGSRAGLSFKWRAIGNGTQTLETFEISQWLDAEPLLKGSILQGEEGELLSWDEQRASINVLLGSLEWQPLVREALMKAYPAEY